MEYVGVFPGKKKSARVPGVQVYMLSLYCLYCLSDFKKSGIPFSCAYTCTNCSTVTIQLPWCRRFTMLYNAGMDGFSFFFFFKGDKIWFKLCFKYINICIWHLNKG